MQKLLRVCAAERQLIFMPRPIHVRFIKNETVMFATSKN